MVVEWVSAHWELLFVFALLLAALVIFVLELLPFEITSLGVLVLLAASGVLSVPEAFSGFSNPALLTILMMFILSEAIVQSGLVDRLGQLVGRWFGTGIVRQAVVIVLIVGPVSAFINNTAAVAVLIPLVVRLANQAGRSPSKLLIPLSFGAMLGGTVTLVGTSTNLLASDIRDRAGLGPFDMFEFSQAGLVVFGIGALYLVLVGHRLVPARVEARALDDRYHLREFLFEVRVPAESTLIGKTVGAANLVQQYDVEVVRLLRNKKSIDPFREPIQYQPEDRYLVRSTRANLERMAATGIVEILPVAGKPEWEGDTQGFTELLVAPGSPARGKRLGQLDLEGRHRVRALALLSRGRAHAERLYHRRLHEGDVLLVQGNKADLEHVTGGAEFHVLGGPETPVRHPDKVPIVLVTFIAVVGIAAMGWAPIILTATAGSVLLVAGGALRLEEMYESIRWDIVFLLAGIIPLGIAVEKTGAAELIAGLLAKSGPYLPPLVLLGIVYVLTMILTELISNNASIVLIAPIALQLSMELGYNPTTFLLAAMFAASTPFLTPVGYQTNLMVLGPGGYRFSDFARVGAPLNFTLAIATPLVLNHFWPIV